MTVVLKIDTAGSAESVRPDSIVSLPANRAVLDGDQITLETKIGDRQNIGFWTILRRSPLVGQNHRSRHVCRLRRIRQCRAKPGDVPGSTPVYQRRIASTGNWGKPKLVVLGRIDFKDAGV